MAIGTFNLLLALGFITAYVYFIFTQYRTFELIDVENRAMSPGAVWFQLIPVLGFLWSLYVVSSLSQSIYNQLSKTKTFSFEEDGASGREVARQPTLHFGLAYTACFLIQLLPVYGLKAVFSLAGLVCWVVYWVQLTNYRRQLA